MGTVPERAVSSLVISRAAFHAAMHLRREATLLCFTVQQPAFSCTRRSCEEDDAHAMGRQPWSPRAGSAVFGPAPSSRELPVAKCHPAQLEGILQGCVPMKIGKNSAPSGTRFAMSPLPERDRRTRGR